MRAGIVMMESNASFAVGFSYSQKIYCQQIFVYHSEFNVFHSTSGRVATCTVFPKKQATICYDVLLPRLTVVRLGSFWKTHTEDCCLGSGSYEKIHDSSPVTISKTCFEAPPS